jgi:hypothetical protein
MDHPGGVENVAAAIVASYLQPSHEGSAGLSRKGGPCGLACGGVGTGRLCDFQVQSVGALGTKCP